VTAVVDFDIRTMPAWATLALLNGPVFGSERQGGFHTEGDVLVDKTADGVPLQKLWDDQRELLSMWSSHQDAITSLLAFKTTEVAEAVPQTMAKFTFEEATEFGEPRGARHGDFLLVGYDFRDYDLATRFTWKFLRGATARQVEHDMNAALEGDQRLRSAKILQRIFDPTQGVSPEGNPIYGAFNGDDGIVPLEYMGTEFDSDHNHYLVSGAATLDSGDVEDSIKLILEHGYGLNPGSRILVFANENECDRIASWRAGVESRSGGPVAKHDFIPSSDAVPFMSSDAVIGAVPPAEFNRLRITGSYGRALIAPTPLISTGYILTAATSGVDSPQNVVGFREHPNPSYQGLRVIPGMRPAYPILDQFYQRSFGVGCRHRGAAVVTQIKSSGDYETPTISA